MVLVEITNGPHAGHARVFGPERGMLASSLYRGLVEFLAQLALDGVLWRLKVSGASRMELILAAQAESQVLEECADRLSIEFEGDQAEAAA